MKLKINTLTVNFNVRLFLVLVFWLGIALTIINANTQFFADLWPVASLITLAPFWLVFDMPENWVQVLKNGPTPGAFTGIYVGAVGLMLHVVLWYAALKLSFIWATNR